jgi:hypothetical protein
LPQPFNQWSGKFATPTQAQAAEMLNIIATACRGRPASFHLTAPLTMPLSGVPRKSASSN